MDLQDSATLQRLISMILMIRQRQRQQRQAISIAAPAPTVDDLNRERESARRRRRIMIKRSLIALLTSSYTVASLERSNRVRRVWVLQRSTHWWREIVMHTWLEDNHLTDQKMRSFFRVSYRTFRIIVSYVQIDLLGQDTSMRTDLPVEEKVALALLILGKGLDFAMAGEVLGIAESTCRKWLFPTVIEGFRQTDRPTETFLL
jgi:hypothetical protein